MRNLVVACALLGGACHHVRTHTPGDEWLRAIVIEGNHAFDDSALRSGLVLNRTLRAGRPLDPYQVQVDADRIRTQYHRAGYFSVDVRARVEHTGDAATVIYTIEEGKRAGVRLSVTGLPSEIDASLPLHDHTPFDYARYDAAKTTVLGIVHDAGYAHAKLDARVTGDRATNTATIDLTIEPGPKCRFGEVTVDGVDGDLRGAVIDRLQFETGQTYSTAAITASQRALYGMGRFSTVQVSPQIDGAGEVVAVKVAVAESAPRQVTLGGGFGMEPTAFEVRARAGYEIAGWPSDLSRSLVDLRPAYAYLRDGGGYDPRIRALARTERLDLLTTYAVGSIEGGLDYLSYEAFTHYGPRAQLAYDLPVLTPRVKLHAGWTIHRYYFRDAKIDPELQHAIGIDHDEHAGAYEQALVVDLRDHPIEPRLGGYFEMRVAEGTRFAASDYEYLRVVPELRGFVPLGDVVLAARGRAGKYFGDAPPTERFFAGGASSQRGFSIRTLAPSDGDVPYGGIAMIDSSLEARMHLGHIRGMPIGGVTFLDGADVTNSAAELDPMNLHWAAGVGVRVMTLIGPARADLGYRLNRTGAMEPAPGSRFAFHLSLGEAF